MPIVLQYFETWITSVLYGFFTKQIIGMITFWSVNWFSNSLESPSRYTTHISGSKEALCCAWSAWNQKHQASVGKERASVWKPKHHSLIQAELCWLLNGGCLDPWLCQSTPFFFVMNSRITGSKSINFTAPQLAAELFLVNNAVIRKKSHGLQVLFSVVKSRFSLPTIEGAPSVVIDRNFPKSISPPDPWKRPISVQKESFPFVWPDNGKRARSSSLKLLPYKKEQTKKTHH